MYVLENYKEKKELVVLKFRIVLFLGVVEDGMGWEEYWVGVYGGFWVIFIVFFFKLEEKYMGMCFIFSF